MDEKSLEDIKKEAQIMIEKAVKKSDLDAVYAVYLGKEGKIIKLFKGFSNLPKNERASMGRLANEAKLFISDLIDEKTQVIGEQADRSTKASAFFDVTIPAKKPELGHLHPLTQVERRIEDIFSKMGFEAVEGPEIESEWYNFEALNIPKDHPSRDMWSTLYLKKGGLLRTHTSPVQIRYMKTHNPPFKIIAPGRVFRHEATDASHEINFYQVEGLVVDKDISVAHFKAFTEEFFRQFFPKTRKTKEASQKNKNTIRLRPSYFPFTEPSFEVDLLCPNCRGRGCNSCKKTGWMEVMGAGMVHPNVFKAVGLNPKNWQGFAFGLGMDRMAMIKYGVNDIRLFYENDYRFLCQF